MRQNISNFQHLLNGIQSPSYNYMHDMYDNIKTPDIAANIHSPEQTEPH